MTAKKLNPAPIQNRRLTPAILALALVFTLASCSPVRKAPAFVPRDSAAAATPFLPAPPSAATSNPLVEAASSSASSSASAAGKPTSAPACLDNLTWVSDVSIPDGTAVSASSTLDKRWEVKNSGNCNWDERYRLRLIAGPGMNAAQEQALYPARSGTSAVLRIVFQAPQQAGKYRSAWQAFNPAGQPFGDPIFIDISVK